MTTREFFQKASDFQIIPTVTPYQAQAFGDLLERFANTNPYTEGLRKRAEDCRNAQKRYFKTRKQADLTASKQAEAELDQYLNGQQTLL